MNLTVQKSNLFLARAGRKIESEIEKISSDLASLENEIKLAISNWNSTVASPDVVAFWRQVELELRREKNMKLEHQRMKLENQRQLGLVQKQNLILVPHSEEMVWYQRDLTEFLTSFRRAYAAREGLTDPRVLEFQCESGFAGFLANRNGSYKYLIQQQYIDIWEDCQKRLGNGDLETNKQSVIVGTAGIGKSASRLLYIAMWLENEMAISLETVIFNINNRFFCVHSNGVVASIDIARMDLSKALLLLDPCNFLHNAQTVGCYMLMVFTSPSSLFAKPNKPCLSGLDKSSEIYVMKAPTVHEARKLHSTIDESMLQLVTWEREGLEYCSLRWLGYGMASFQTKLMGCLSQVSSDGLWDWFVTNTQPISKDPRLPFRLCVVELRESEWIVTGFLSTEIERCAARWAMGSGRRKANELANLLENRMLTGGLGIFFERWVFDILGEGETLTLDGATAYSFQSMRIIPPGSLKMNSGIVYKLDRARFPSIEGYVRVGTELLLLQSTVSVTHRGARFNDVKEIVSAANQAAGQKSIVRVIYIVLSSVADSFTLPQCQGFPSSTTFHIATVDDSQFFHHLNKT